MFARFRDENAFAEQGFVMPDTARMSGMVAESRSGNASTDNCYSFELNSGRVLAWAEFGHRHGYPVLYMHREGGCRLEARLLHEAAKAAGFRLIAVDRPGLGRSDYLAFRNPGDIADDYVQLIDHLGFQKVAVFSWGGGSYFASAMAVRFAERVSFLTLLSPHERNCGITRLRFFGVLVKLSLRLVLSVRSRLGAASDNRRYLQRWREQMCYADRKLIEDPDVRSVIAGITRESTYKGTAGLAQDIWFGISASDDTEGGLSDISQVMPVHIWSGSADAFTRMNVSLRSVKGGAAEGRSLGVFRHWVRRQGYLFFRHVAGDIFRVARQTVGLNPVAGGPTHH